MKAIAHSQGGFKHMVAVRGHRVSVDQPRDGGGRDDGPSPQELLAASLASCTAVTMEMYAQRKGWDLRDVWVACEYAPAERGCPTRFEIVLGLPPQLTDYQVGQLRVIAAKCPIHRTLDGEVMFTERVERPQLTA